MSYVETILEEERKKIKSHIEINKPFAHIKYLKQEYNLKTSINKLNNIVLEQYNFYKQNKIKGDLIYLSLAHLTRMVVTEYDKQFQDKIK